MHLQMIFLLFFFYLMVFPFFVFVLEGLLSLLVFLLRTLLLQYILLICLILFLRFHNQILAFHVLSIHYFLLVTLNFPMLLQYRMSALLIFLRYDQMYFLI